MGRTTYLLLQVILTLADIISHVQGSGTLYDPPNRAVMWKYGYNTPKNYNYMQLNCGGEKQNETGNWHCGVCGDGYNSTRQHELGGRYATGMISRYYPAGIKEMPVKVELLAYEQGFFEFRLCSADNKTEVTQECLDDNILPIKEGYLAGTPLRFYPKGAGDFRLTVAVPPNFTCNRCVLQWRYHTANSWGTNPDTYREGLGEGPQEEFRNCADIRIGGTIPKSVRNNPFFAPPDARPSSAIDKPTDQRKKLASRKDKLDISMTSDGIQSSSGWVNGKTGIISKNPMRIPDVKQSGTQVIGKQISSAKRHGASRLIPIVDGTEGSESTKQTNIIQRNDINAKQHNGLFSMDNAIQDASKTKHSGEQSISGGTVEIIGHRKQVGNIESRMTSGTGFSGNIDSRMAQGVDLSGGTDSKISQHTDLALGGGSHMAQDTGSMGGMASRMTGKINSHRSEGTSNNRGMDSKISLETDLTRAIDAQVSQETGFVGSIESQITQGTGLTAGSDIKRTQGSDLTVRNLGTNTGGRSVHTESVIPKGSAVQRVEAVERITSLDPTMGAVGLAPIPERKSSILIESASISKKTSEPRTGKMNAVTRSGFTMSGDKTLSNTMKTDTQQLENTRQQTPTSSAGVFLDLSQLSGQNSIVSSQSNTPINKLQAGIVGGQSRNVDSVASDGIDRSQLQGNMFTDLAIDGTHSNTITDKVNTNLDKRLSAQKVAFKNIHQPITADMGTAGTGNVGMNTHSGSSGTTFDEVLSGTAGSTNVVESLQGSPMDRKEGKRQKVVETVHSGKGDILSSGENESPDIISSLTPSSSRQRIFLVRASRPSTVLLSGTASGGMTVPESVHFGTDLVHTSVDKSSSTLGKTLFQDKTNNMQSGKKSPNNAAIKLSTGKRQETSSSVQRSLPSEIDVNSINPVSKLDFAVGGQLVDVTASEVIDPSRTQMARSDGRVAGEHELLPSGHTVLVTEKKVHGTSGHASSGSGGDVINDVDLFRNELVKSSLRQGSAFVDNKAAVKTHAHTEAGGHAHSEQQKGSSSIDGTNLLASNEIGGKLGSSSLDQTVNDLLKEAQKLLSSTADITNTQTSTDTASVSKTGTAPVADVVNEKTQVHKHASFASPEISRSVHGSHETSMHRHIGSTGESVKQGTGVNKGHVDILSSEPEILTLDYLLGGSFNDLHGTSTDSLGHLVESAHGHDEHAGDTRSGGSAKNEHILSSTAESIHNILPESHGTGGSIDAGADASQHSAGFHTNIIDIKSKADHMSQPTEATFTARKSQNVAPVSTIGAKMVGGSSKNAHGIDAAGHANNVLASHTEVHGADVGVDPRSSLLPMVDVIGHDTGIVFNDASAGSMSNVNPVATKSLTGNQQTTGLELIRDIKNTALVNPSGPKPDMTNADHFGSAGVQNVINKPIGTNGVNPTGSGHDGSVKSQQSVQPVLNKKGRVSGTTDTGTLVGSLTKLASGIDTGTAVRLGGNVIDLTSDSSSSKDTQRLTTGQSKTGTGASDINLLSAGRTLRQRNGIIPEHIVHLHGDSAQKTSGSSILDRVDQTVSSRPHRQRVIGANNIVTPVRKADPVPTTARTDGVSIERQINAFSLENIPSSAVIGAGVQMTADGRMIAGFGPRGRDMSGESARENMRRDVIRGDIDRRTLGSSDGSVRIVRDPRTGLEERIPSDIRHSGNIRGGSMDQRATIEGRHSHPSGTSGSASNPVYFLDMSGSASSDTRLADSTTVRELPSAEIGRSSSERRVTELRDGRRRIGGAAGAGFETSVGGSRFIADTGIRVNEGNIGMDSGRRMGIDRGNTRLEMGMRGSGSRTDSGTRFRESDFRPDTRRQTATEIGGTRLDIGMGSSGPASSSRTGIMESGFRTDSFRPTGGDRLGSEFDSRIRGVGSSVDSGIRFRETSRGADSRGQVGGSMGGVAGFDARMGGSRSIGGTGTPFREGDFRMGVPRSTFDSGIGVREGRFRVDSSRRLDGDLRGERRADMGREGMRMLPRRRELVLGDRRIPAASTVVPFGAPMTSTSGSFSGAMTPMRVFPSGGPPFRASFPRFIDSGSMMGGSMSVPFDGRFRPAGVSPEFGPSLGGPSFVSGMAPPRMGPGFSIPSFSPIGFVPGML